MSTIQERVRKAQAKAAAERQKPEREARALQNRRMAAAEARDIKLEKGIDEALRTGVARNAAERRALDYDMGIES